MAAHRNAAQLFCFMAIQYAVLTVNTLAISSHNWLGLLITDLLVAWLAFTILKRVGEATTRFEMIAYMCGGALGAQIALFVGLRVFDR